VSQTASWHLRGSYFEACNCDPICPCRRVDGEAGGRSTHGICTGVLSWIVEDGAVGDLDLSGLPVALAIRYSDDEEGSPWTWVLYVAEEASDEQADALAAIFSGSLGGDALKHFPWAWKPSIHVAVRRATFEVDHTPRRQRLRVRDWVEVRIRDRFAGEQTVTCVIPGHDRSGEELVAERIAVADGPLEFQVEEVCGYASTFSYAG
jgi:hypothetical protein